MTVEERPDALPATADPRSARGRRSGLVASALLMISALLQAVAAAQRWAFTDAETVGSDRTIEDHLFDYVIPADPWVSVGTAATLFGLGYLLVGAALVCLGVAGRGAGRRAHSILPVSLVAAAPFVLLGVHALASGLSGVASPIQHLVATYGALALGAVQVITLILFAVLVRSRSWMWAIGVLLLIGVTVFGYIGAMFFIAPMIMGYQSYDTTPWSEAMMAATTAASVVAVFIGAVRLVPSGSTD